jgi:regulator of nonsense transcripts 1
VPSEQDQLRARQITSRQISDLEELWRSKPEAVLEDLTLPGAENDAVKTLLRFGSAVFVRRVKI